MTKRDDGGVPVSPAPVSDEKQRAIEAGVIPPEGKTKRDVAKDYSGVKFVRGQVIAIRREASVRVERAHSLQPCIIKRIGGDGSVKNDSTVHYAIVKPGGALGHEHWIADWELRRLLTEGNAHFIDGAKVQTLVDLPPEWAAQVERHAAAVTEARQARVEAGKDPLDDVAPVTHPSYGVVRLTRASGYGFLFGSAFKHHSRICIEIHRAVLHRSLSNDRPHPAEEIIEIDMSEAQFAHFITSAAVGEGTPCTIRHLLGAMMPETPPPEETEKFHADAKRTIRRAGENVREAIAEARVLLDKPGNITKKEREALIGKLHGVERAFSDSLPFTVEQFGERMEKIVAAGKHEIDAYLTRVAAKVDGAALPSPISMPTLTGGEVGVCRCGQRLTGSNTCLPCGYPGNLCKCEVQP